MNSAASASSEPTSVLRVVHDLNQHVRCVGLRARNLGDLSACCACKNQHPLPLVGEIVAPAIRSVVSGDPCLAGVVHCLGIRLAHDLESLGVGHTSAKSSNCAARYRLADNGSLLVFFPCDQCAATGPVQRCGSSGDKRAHQGESKNSSTLQFHSSRVFKAISLCATHAHNTLAFSAFVAQLRFRIFTSTADWALITRLDGYRETLQAELFRYIAEILSASPGFKSEEIDSQLSNSNDCKISIRFSVAEY